VTVPAVSTILPSTPRGSENAQREPRRGTSRVCRGTGKGLGDFSGSRKTLTRPPSCTTRHVRGAGGGSGGCANPDPDIDYDGDGFTARQGDCDECAAGINPGAYDVPGDGVDQDCSGKADDEPTGCDASITSIDDSDPVDAAHAIGLCRMAQGKSWGLVSAEYVKADGSTPMAAASHGILSDFGPNVSVREGTKLLALSSGTARRPTDPGYQDPSGADMGTTSLMPTGFPTPTPFCPSTPNTDNTANDPAALEVVVRVPTNVQSFSVDYDFYSYEFPDYVCTQYADNFALLQTPAPGVTVGGSITFDNDKDAISVNNGLVSVCTAQTAGGQPFACPLGQAQLSGTGFEGHAATGWLTTRSPVQPGSEVTLRFAIWDAGDHILDSTVLVDNFRWSADPVGAPSTAPAQ
jgi:Putative metal-binding motif